MRLQFGDFTLDTDSRQLERGHRRVHLSPKAFELLRALLENRPRALSKAELHDRLWPATFIADTTLTSLVAELRAALNDPARKARFVRTVHRFGYAFCGEAREISARGDRPADVFVRHWLVWDSGQTALSDGENIIGRDHDVTVWLDSPTVSRHHARIRISGARATVEDLGSKNGTYVREEQVASPRVLVDGDEIRVGSVKFTFRVAAAQGSTQTQPSRRPSH